MLTTILIINPGFNSTLDGERRANPSRAISADFTASGNGALSVATTVGRVRRRIAESVSSFHFVSRSWWATARRKMLSRATQLYCLYPPESSAQTNFESEWSGVRTGLQGGFCARLPCLLPVVQAAANADKHARKCSNSEDWTRYNYQIIIKTALRNVPS